MTKTITIVVRYVSFEMFETDLVIVVIILTMSDMMSATRIAETAYNMIDMRISNIPVSISSVMKRSATVIMIRFAQNIEMSMIAYN
jgi:hypothetical protein